MVLVIVLAAIGVAGLLMVAGYAVWLAHKTSDLVAELKVLSQRGQQLARTVAEIAPPDRSPEPTGGQLATPSAGQKLGNAPIMADRQNHNETKS